MIYIWHQLSQEPGLEPGAKQQDIASAKLHTLLSANKINISLIVGVS